MDGEKISALSVIRNLFDKEPCNTGRQPELDLAKGFAIIFMIWVHTLEMTGVYEEKGIAGFVVMLCDYIFGSPFAAPVFMVCLGIGIVYSKRSYSATYLARRGFNLAIVSFVLNIMRYWIPERIWDYFDPYETFRHSLIVLFEVDILQFAALAFFFFAIVKKLNLSNRVIFAFALAASVAGRLLRYHSVGSKPIDILLGYLWGTDADTYFPFLNWLIFTVVGYLIGCVLIRCKDKRKLYRMLSPVCMAAGVIYLFVAYWFELGMFAGDLDYYYPGPIETFFYLLLTVGIFGLDYWLSGMLPDFMQKPLKRMSNNINAVYCIHWVILGYLNMILGLVVGHYLSIWMVTMLAILLCIVSDFVAWLYKSKMRKK